MRYFPNNMQLAFYLEDSDCDGAFSQVRRGQGYVFRGGLLKSPVIKGDGVKPTPYSCSWNNLESPAKFYLKANGPHFNNYCERTKYFRETRGNYDFVSPQFGIPGFSPSTNWQDSIPQLPGPMFDTRWMNRQVDQAILSKIGDSKLSLGVQAGEMKESANLLLDLTEDLLIAAKFIKTGKRDPLSFIRYLATKPSGRPLLNGKPHWDGLAKESDSLHARHGRPYTGAQWLKRKWSDKQLTALGFSSQAMANRWLQYRYGIIPLYNEVIKTFDYLITVAESQPLYSSRVTIPLPFLGLGGDDQFGFYSKIMLDDPPTGFQQVKIWYSVKDASARKSQQLGLSIESIPSVLYELTPLSFILDWAWPIGNTLETLGATKGLKFEFGYRSQKYQVQYGSIFLGQHDNTGRVTQQVPADVGRVVSGSFIRVPLTEFPSVSLPVVRDPFGKYMAERITDLVSLSRQFINLK